MEHGTHLGRWVRVLTALSLDAADPFLMVLDTEYFTGRQREALRVVLTRVSDLVGGNHERSGDDTAAQYMNQWLNSVPAEVMEQLTQLVEGYHDSIAFRLEQVAHLMQGPGGSLVTNADVAERTGLSKIETVASWNTVLIAAPAGDSSPELNWARGLYASHVALREAMRLRVATVHDLGPLTVWDDRHWKVGDPPGSQTLNTLSDLIDDALWRTMWRSAAKHLGTTGMTRLLADSRRISANTELALPHSETG